MHHRNTYDQVTYDRNVEWRWKEVRTMPLPRGTRRNVVTTALNGQFALRWFPLGVGLLRRIWLSACIVSSSLLVSGCGSVWEYRERSDGSTVAILKDLDEVLPSYATEWSLIAEASAGTGVEAGAGKLGFSTDIFAIYERMDQFNAQTRNFLVAAYAFYVNAELEDDPQRREEGRKAWKEILVQALQRSIEFRKLTVIRGDLIKDIEKNIEEILSNMPSLSLESAHLDRLRAQLARNIKQLELIEVGMGSGKSSDVAVLGRCILAYAQKHFAYIANTIPQLRTRRLADLYVLAAAYYRLGREGDATRVLDELIEWSNNTDEKRLHCIAYMIKGVISAVKARELKDNDEKKKSGYEKALEHYDAAVRIYPKAGIVYYNRAATYWALAQIGRAPEHEEYKTLTRKCFEDLVACNTHGSLTKDELLQNLRTDDHKAFSGLRLSTWKDLEEQLKASRLSEEER